MAFRQLDTNIVSYILNRHTLAAAYQPHLTGYDLAVSFLTVGTSTPGGNRAHNHPLRRRVLCPVELRGQANLLLSTNTRCIQQSRRGEFDVTAAGGANPTRRPPLGAIQWVPKAAPKEVAKEGGGLFGNRYATVLKQP